jgi:hypothetical protein
VAQGKGPEFKSQYCKKERNFMGFMWYLRLFLVVNCDPYWALFKVMGVANIFFILFKLLILKTCGNMDKN